MLHFSVVVREQRIEFRQPVPLGNGHEKHEGHGIFLGDSEPARLTDEGVCPLLIRIAGIAALKYCSVAPDHHTQDSLLETALASTWHLSGTG